MTTPRGFSQSVSARLSVVVSDTRQRRSGGRGPRSLGSISFQASKAVCHSSRRRRWTTSKGRRRSLSAGDLAVPGGLTTAANRQGGWECDGVTARWRALARAPPARASSGTAAKSAGQFSAQATSSTKARIGPGRASTGNGGTGGTSPSGTGSGQGNGSPWKSAGPAPGKSHSRARATTSLPPGPSSVASVGQPVARSPASILPAVCMRVCTRLPASSSAVTDASVRRKRSARSTSRPAARSRPPARARKAS